MSKRNNNNKKEGKESKDPKDFKNQQNGKKGGKPFRPNSNSGGANKPPKDGGKPSNQDVAPTGYSINDVDWYAYSDSVLRDVASYPFSNAVGASINEFTYSVPGIMILRFNPAIGYSNSARSAINTAALKFYAFVRQANSGAKVYEAADMMMYFMACTQVFACIEHAKRVYGVLKKFSNYNKYMGRTLVKAALGSIGADDDYEWLLANQADYRARLNILINQANKVLHIPKDLKFLKRLKFLNSVIAADAGGKKFQLYLPLQKNFLEYDATGYPTGTSLKAVDANIEGTPILKILERMLDVLISDEDINIMSGDILKAYGDSGCEAAEELALDYEVDIVYNIPFLAQIHNLVMPTNSISYVGLDADSNYKFETSPVIYQQGGIIYHQPVTSMQYDKNTFGRNGFPFILDIPVESPTPGDVMESTRMMQALNSSEAITVGSTTAYGIVCGSEVWDQAFLVTTTGDSVTAMQFYSRESTADSSVYVHLVNFSAFSWCPRVYLWTTNSPTATTKPLGTVGDISNYTIMQTQDIKDLHESALYGLFDIPVQTVR